jgi:magnesium-transporting ATPase (P-type)
MDLAGQGYRVIALAAAGIELKDSQVFSEENLANLTLIGLVGLIDPLRPEAKEAIANCRKAGIKVAMITGDHPVTAAAISRELKLAESNEAVVTGADLKRAAERGELDVLTTKAHVFARVEPKQKLEIVESLQRNGHFVAVSGDGANDAPALQAAHIGVAMGESGTDVARETADLIITDDNFSSIVAGVREGRVAYANVRKVIFLLISTGFGEIVLFTLALLAGLPLPLLAVQLLWLNLVTNGIQDLALAFEKAEGDELEKPPRPPRDPIFNRMMVERVVLSGCVIGSVAFLLYQWMLNRGYEIDEARNATLLLMVLFENIHVLNCRSESRSAFSTRLFSNPFLVMGTISAQLIHIGAMYTPWLSETLQIQPISFQLWLELLLLAFVLLFASEAHKLIRRLLNRKIG